MTAFALKGLHRLDLGTRAALIDEAASLGIGSERADVLLGRAGGKLGVALDYGSVAPKAIAAGNGGLPAHARALALLLSTAPTQPCAVVAARGSPS